ncbi:MAG: DUF4326 domain-containing protein [Rhodospirillales bacterium]|nr:DUF4326 domain-containing protein [Rhodospirillales bacterium]
MADVANIKHRPDLVRLLSDGHRAGVVRIDRRTRWGNPFVIGRDGDRAQVIELYRRDLWRRIRAGEIALEDLAALNSKTLLCHCHPLPCHGDVLARAAAWAAARLGRT